MSSLPPKIKLEKVTIQKKAALMPLIAFDDDSSISDSSVKAVNGMDAPHVSAVKLEADAATDMNDADVDKEIAPSTKTAIDMKEEVVAVEEKTTYSEQGKKPTAISTIRGDAAATVATAGPIYSLLSSDEDEDTDSESTEKNEKGSLPRGIFYKGQFKRNNWEVQIYYAGKNRYIGMFNSREKACLAYEISREVLKIGKKGKGMTREQMSALSHSEKAKVEAKAEEIRKESESIHLSSDEDEDANSESNDKKEAAKKKVTSPWNLLPWKLFQQEMKGKGMTREQIRAEYQGLSPSEKAKLQAKADKIRKESESMQGANKNNQSNQGGGNENVDVAWKCHQCQTLNALYKLRCNGFKESGHRCMAYKGKRSKNTSTSTEGCELVWLEKGAKLGLRHDNSDECFICRMGGSLLCCDFCDKSFHLGCHVPPLDSVPFGDFKCCECRAPTLKKLFHCGSCQICLRGELNQCPNKRYAEPAIVSPAKQKSNPDLSTVERNGAQTADNTADESSSSPAKKTNPSTIERNGAQTADNTCESSEDDIPNDLVACQRELKRSREEIKKQEAEIKRLKGALQAMIA